MRRRRPHWYQGRRGYFAGGGGLFGLVLTALSLRRYFRGRRASGYAA
jgi:hypothetical protein